VEDFTEVEGSEAKEAMGRIRDEALLHRLHKLLDRLPTTDVPSLIDMLREMHETKKGSLSSGELERVQNVFFMEVLICLHEIVRDHILRILAEIELKVKYFNQRVCNTVFDLIGNSSVYLEEAAFTPLQVGVQEWCNSVLFARKVRLRRHLRKIQAIRRRLLIEAAEIHHRLHEMEQLDAYKTEDDMLQQWIYTYCDTLHEQLEGSQPNYSREDPSAPLLHLLSESLSEFESRVGEYMDLWDLHRPSHIVQYWPAYMLGVGGALAASQTSWGAAIGACGMEVGKCVVWDFVLAPLGRNVVNASTGFSRVRRHTKNTNNSSPTGAESEAYSSVQRSKRTLSVLLKDYEDRYSPEAKAIMHKASMGDLTSLSSADLKSEMEYQGVIHGLLIQIQKLRVDLDTSILQLVRLVEANRFAFGFMIALPAVLLLGTCALAARWGLQLGSSRAAAARRIRRRLRRIENLLIHSPHRGDTAALGHLDDLYRLGKMLHHLRAIDVDRERLGGEMKEALDEPVGKLRRIGLDIDGKLRLVEQMAREIRE